MATIKVTVPVRRLLSRAEAQAYVNLPAKAFTAVCPVQPIALVAGRDAFDVRDLDAWIDLVKGGEVSDLDALLARLA